ncbi:protein of unknown function [Burkholderia multivorans]
MNPLLAEHLSLTDKGICKLFSSHLIKSYNPTQTNQKLDHHDARRSQPDQKHQRSRIFPMNFSPQETP